MPLPSVRRRDIATRVGLTIGGGGAGWLGAIAVIHQPGAAAVAAVAVAAALATSIAEVIFTSLPEIIKARGEAKKESLARPDKRTTCSGGKLSIPICPKGAGSTMRPSSGS